MNKDSADLAAENTDSHSKRPLCREPWEYFYILRRGIIPCCYGSEALALMPDWKEAWNSPELQEIRRYLSQGKLSPYCLRSRSCPIVQRHAREYKNIHVFDQKRLAILRFINRMLFKIPGKIYRMINR